jgi:hypothetical protein
MQATGMVNDHLVDCFRYRELACLSQLGRSAAGKPFRISGGVQKVSTTKWVCGRGESSCSNQAALSFAMRSYRK